VCDIQIIFVSQLDSPGAWELRWGPPVSGEIGTLIGLAWIGIQAVVDSNSQEALLCKKLPSLHESSGSEISSYAEERLSSSGME
jgi:hypothetical protein